MIHLKIHHQIFHIYKFDRIIRKYFFQLLLHIRSIFVAFDTTKNNVASIAEIKRSIYIFARALPHSHIVIRKIKYLNRIFFSNMEFYQLSISIIISSESSQHTVSDFPVPLWAQCEDKAIIEKYVSDKSSRNVK